MRNILYVIRKEPPVRCLMFDPSVSQLMPVVITARQPFFVIADVAQNTRRKAHANMPRDHLSA